MNRTKLISTALSLCAVAIMETAVVAAERLPNDLDDLQGFWRYDNPEFAWGCDDTDGQYRVAIGRWIYDESLGRVVFGVGRDAKIGFYDASCILSNKQRRGNTLIYDSECISEGEEFSGVATIEAISMNVIQLKNPVTTASVLIRCPVASR